MREYNICKLFTLLGLFDLIIAFAEIVCRRAVDFGLFVLGKVCVEGAIRRVPNQDFAALQWRVEAMAWVTDGVMWHKKTEAIVNE